jgi:large subunit ribosomal protein L35
MILPKSKLKTHRGAAKRFKLTATGKVIRGHAYARHILTSKSSNRKRKLDQNTTVSPSDVRRVRVMLPYGR